MTKQQPCLAYIDTDAQPPVWRCADVDVTSTPIDEKLIAIAGQTSHFTNFGILLSSGDSESVSESTDGFTVPWWIYVAVAGVVLVAITIAVIIFVAKKVKRDRERKQVVQMLEVSKHTSM